MTNSLLKEKIIADADEDIVRFGLQSLEGNLLSIIVTLVVGIYFKRVGDALLLWLFLFPLRKNAGGYHAANKKRCLLISIIMLVVSFTFLSIFRHTTIFYGIYASMAGLIIWVLAPVDNLSKKLDVIECKVYQKRSRTIVGIEGMILILSLYFQWETITRSIIMTFFIASISLIMGIIKLAVNK